MKQMKPVRILFSAINGYGFYYLKTLFEEISEEQAVICGVIAPHPQKSAYYEKLTGMGVPIYTDFETYFKDGNTADLTVISSPLQYHVPQTITALEYGSNVLVDKPVGVTPEEVERLISMRQHTDRWVEVGYQWSFSEPIQKLKKDILSGKFGKAIRMKALCMWPRPYAYFNRNNWAGKIRSNDGTLILDSVANNANAHHLHNLFFLSGPEMNSSAVPVTVTGERYRAYDIENFDTVTCKATTNTGVDIHFYATHVAENQVNPAFVLEFEKASVRLDADSNGIVATMADGSTLSYGHPDADHQFKKLWVAIEKCHMPGVTICPPEAALSQTICINALNDLSAGIKNFPVESVVFDEDRRWVKGLGEKVMQAYQTWGTLE